jgi:hypothetical protein
VVTVRVSDGTGYFEADWNFTVDNVNRRPVIAECWPLNNTRCSGAALDFRATASDPDGDPLTFVWRLSDGTVLRTQSGTNGSSFKTKLSPDRSFIVILEVTDGQGGLERQYIYLRTGPGDTGQQQIPVLGAGLVIAAIALTTATASFWRRKRR